MWDELLTCTIVVSLEQGEEGADGENISIFLENNHLGRIVQAAALEEKSF